MAHYEGVTVKVISDGKTCPMYDDPDADGHKDPFSLSSPPHKYIEAVTGAKFAVVVTLEPSFQFANCDGVRVRYYLDGGKLGYELTIESKRAIGGSLENRTLRFSSVRKYCPKTGQFQRGDLTFGELKIHERNESTTSVSEIKGLGQLQVCWQRIHFGKDTVREYTKDITESVSEVSEKVLKGKAIENAIKCSNLQPIVGSSTYIYKEGIPMSGLLGRSVRLHIVYRSKRTLQMLGCIPRSPSPAPLNRRSEGAVVEPDDPQEELRALRARVAELENRTSDTPQPVVKSEQHRSTSKVKRERENNENEVKQKRSRRSGPPEVVDLTAD